MTSPITSKEDLIERLIPGVQDVTDRIRAHKVGGTTSAERQIIEAMLKTLADNGVSLHNSARCIGNTGVIND